ncbi:mechanosensitive ion channel protein MscS [Sulfodiicoccus acidiphilus]|uniref:Mechanosensitive ion channel protein MscS n=1 Tax=Sulfodiicoccus acidiphilus TaxID=1670455 RepID=A0A348B4K2_9CREN|nr:mechanosensitive ion channel domain-containing protein [Sulfodiicoccus acidiphilus]BBD73104.1 mechanosensitive ion channel protein MscS [Sulfodiicoccus acidiphilus]GGU00753.1 mechanosensitive ion channel protein MscS [Sulfodiicoccus acidiphilus]
MSASSSSMRNQLIKIFLAIVATAVVAYFVRFLLLQFLPKYSVYVQDAINAVLVGLVGYVVVSIVLYVFRQAVTPKMTKAAAHVLELAMEVLLYTLLVMAVLSALGVNLTGAAIGGAVVGIAVGLAAQTILNNLLSGFLVSLSKTLAPDDPVIVQSWIWSPPVIGKVQRVSTLFTDVLTVTGNVVRLPNSAFLGNATFTKLEGTNSLSYTYQVTVQADVPAKQVLEKVSKSLEDSFKGQKLPAPEIYFSSKAGTTNVFTVVIHMDVIERLNQLVDLVNRSFDSAYWDTKSQPK